MESNEGGHDYTYRAYPTRWRMVGIISLFNFVVQLSFITFAPIATPAAAFYGVDVTAINWLALVWAAVFAPGTVVAAWSMHKYGLRRSILAASAVSLVGAVVRALSGVFDEEPGEFPNNNVAHKSSTGAYALLIIGTILMATVQPIVLSSTTLTAAAWFSEKQRNLANTIMAVANPLGLAAGSVLAPVAVSETNPQRINGYLAVQAAAFLVVAIATLFLQSHPPTAPSATAAYKLRRPDLKADIKSLRHNFGFLALANIFALSVGALTALLTLMEQILRPKGYSLDDAGTVSAVLILAGIAGIALVGPLLDKTRAYKLILSVSLTVTVPFYILFTYHTQKTGQLHLLLVFAALVGFFGFPVLPTALDMSAETTYPISAGLTSALLWMGSQVTALVLVIVIDGPLKENIDIQRGNRRTITVSSLDAGAWLLVGCVVAAMFLAWFWTGRYVRHEAEGTVQRLRQAQRRDIGVPFVDIIADSAPDGSVPEGASQGALLRTAGRGPQADNAPPSDLDEA